MSDLPDNPKTRLIQAVLWMIVVMLSFSAMAIAALSADLEPLEIVVLRSGLGLLIVLLLVGRSGFQTVRTARLRMHFLRNIVHFGGNLTWIIGVTMIPLASVFALEFTIPIWVALLAILFLGERLTLGKVVALVCGFGGILIIVRPGLIAFEVGTAFVLASAFFFAVANVCTKTLSATEHPLSILFYMFIIQVPIGVVGAAFVWKMPTLSHLPWILLIGVSAVSSHYCVVRALSLVDATVVLPIDFLRMPLIAVVGFFFYAEPFSPFTFAGAVLIFGGVYYSLLSESRRASAAKKTETP